MGLCNFFWTHKIYFWNHRSSSIPPCTERFRLQRGPSSKRCHGHFLHATKFTDFRTNCGLSSSWQTICSHYGCRHRHGWHCWQPWSNSHTKGWIWQLQCNFMSAKGPQKNYSPFLLKSAAAVWGMDVFNEYLKGKKFILFTDHKPLEKMGHLHTKTMDRLQAALLEHDFVIQYKKGAVMPADWLSIMATLCKHWQNIRNHWMLWSIPAWPVWPAKSWQKFTAYEQFSCQWIMAWQFAQIRS